MDPHALREDPSPDTRPPPGRPADDVLVPRTRMIGDDLAAALDRLRPLSLWLLRALTGAFLAWEVLDNFTDAARMLEFERFVAHFGFPLPALSARVSVGFQFVAGLGLLAGWRVRTFGVLCAGHFLVAFAMVHLHDPFRAAWPALALVAIGLVLATHGGGSWRPAGRATGR